MVKRRHKAPCYYCGRPACSHEHAPPKQMFKGFSCDSITVPSCDDHNSKKGGSDQAIVSALLIPLRNGIGRYSLHSEVLNAIAVAEPSFERAKRKAIDSPLLENAPEALEELPNLAYLSPSIDIRSWIRQLTATMVYDAAKAFDPTIGWPTTTVWSPDWLAAVSPTSVRIEQALSEWEDQKEAIESLKQLNWEEGWSAHPTPYPRVIYSFQVHLELNSQVIFRHRFYEQYQWYCWFLASEETLAALSERLRG